MSGTSLVDQNLAQLANWLMNTAIAVHLLAFVAACAEWAFGGIRYRLVGATDAGRVLTWPDEERGRGRCNRKQHASAGTARGHVSERSPDFGGRRPVRGR
ncbi:hypothetical protein [Streptomyces sp. NPDC004976]